MGGRQLSTGIACRGRLLLRSSLLARWGLRQRAGRRLAAGGSCRISFFSGTALSAFQLLEAEFVVVLHLLQLRLHLRERELQALDLPGERTHLVLELLHAHR